MQTIRAAHNLSIELDPSAWRLVNGAQRQDQPGALIALLEANAQGIQCSPAFTRARRLPAGGRLAPADVARVVVGWAPESQNWHLGLLLANPADAARKVRWCGLASWPSGPSQENMDQARLAGQALAQIIRRPFHLIPGPKEAPAPFLDTQPVQPTVQMPAADPLAELDRQIRPQEPPFTFEEYAFSPIPKGYVWQRRGRWVSLTLFRVVAFSAIAVLFLIMGVGAQTRGLASVSPGWLPLVGILVAGLLALLALQNLREVFAARDVILDTTAREVRCLNRITTRPRWTLPFDTVEYLVVSQGAPQSHGRKGGKRGPMRTTQDVWLHLYDGQRFYPVAELKEVPGLSHDWDTVRHTQKKAGRYPLHIAQYDTPAHHAALFTAHLLETRVWLDIR